MITKTPFTLSSLLFAGVTMFTLHTVDAAVVPTTMNRTLLLEHPVELPSSNITAKTIRVTFPPAFKTPDHTHEGPGPRYVVKGKLKVIEGDKTNIYTAGEVFWETGALMSVENVGDGSAELIIFELSPGK